MKRLILAAIVLAALAATPNISNAQYRGGYRSYYGVTPFGAYSGYRNYNSYSSGFGNFGTYNKSGFYTTPFGYGGFYRTGTFAGPYASGSWNSFSYNPFTLQYQYSYGSYNPFNSFSNSGFGWGY